MPAKIWQHSENYEAVPSAWAVFLAEAAVLQQAALHVEGQGLVNLIVELENERANLRANLIDDLKRFIKLQGATLVEQVLTLPFDNVEPPGVRDLAAARVQARCEEVLHARRIFQMDWVSDETAKQLHLASKCFQEPLSEASRDTLSAAHLQRTFRNEGDVPSSSGQDDAGVADEVVLSWCDRKSQAVFRELCTMKSMARIEEQFDMEIIAAKRRRITEFIDRREHISAVSKTLHRLVVAFGFADIFDESERLVGDEQLAQVAETYQDARRLFKGREPPQELPGNLYAAAAQILRRRWFIAPKEVEQRSGRYKLQRYGHALYWPPFLQFLSDNYIKFSSILAQTESQDRNGFILPVRWGAARPPALDLPKPCFDDARKPLVLDRGDRELSRLSSAQVPGEWREAFHATVEQLCVQSSNLHWQCYVRGPTFMKRLCEELKIATSVQSSLAAGMAEGLNGNLGTATSVLLTLVYQKELHAGGILIQAPIPNGFRKGLASADGYNCFIASCLQQLENMEVGDSNQEHKQRCRVLRLAGVADGVWERSPETIDLSDQTFSFILQYLGLPVDQWQCLCYGGHHGDLLARAGPLHAPHHCCLWNRCGTHYEPLWPAAAAAIPVAEVGDIGPIRIHSTSQTQSDGHTQRGTQARRGGKVGDWAAADGIRLAAWQLWYRGPRSSKGSSAVSGALQGCASSKPEIQCSIGAPCSDCKNKYRKHKERKKGNV